MCALLKKRGSASQVLRQLLFECLWCYYFRTRSIVTYIHLLTHILSPVYLYCLRVAGGIIPDMLSNKIYINLKSELTLENKLLLPNILWFLYFLSSR